MPLTICSWGLFPPLPGFYPSPSSRRALRFLDPFALQVVDCSLLRYNQVEVKGMATETITIQVDREAAEAYKAAAPRDQRKMGALLSLWLKDVAMAEPAALKQMMTDLSKKARDRGLTPEILENLLKEA